MREEAEENGMAGSDYDLLKQKLDEIIATAERFPEGVRELICQSLVEALLHGDNLGQPASADEQDSGSAARQLSVEESSVIDRELASAFANHFAQYKDMKLNDMVFCAVVARFFTREISEELRVESIGPDLLMEAVEIAGRRKRPTNPVTTLNNAKNVGLFLESRGKGVYGISEDGSRKLDNILKERSRLTTPKHLKDI